MSVTQAAQRRTWFTQYRTSNNAENLGSFLYGTYTAQGNGFELILTVKIKTRHPRERSFSSEFRVICNHCVVMEVLKSQDVEIL